MLAVEVHLGYLIFPVRGYATVVTIQINIYIYSASKVALVNDKQPTLL